MRVAPSKESDRAERPIPKIPDIFVVPVENEPSGSLVAEPSAQQLQFAFPTPLPSPSSSPIKQFQEFLLRGVQSCLKLCSDDEPHATSVVREPPRSLRYLSWGSDNPPPPFKPPSDPDLHYSRLVRTPQTTHNLMKLIPRVQCFLVSAAKVEAVRSTSFQTNGKILERLGFCVEVCREKCTLLNCDKCPKCGVCVHMYNCSCPANFKHMGTYWCAHIHLMHTCTQGKLGKGAVLFIHSNTQYKALRHARAIVQGPEFMIPIYPFIPDLFEEQFDNFEATQKYRVVFKGGKCECEDREICMQCLGCLCRFVCNCEDFHTDMQICQHIHSVAMQLEDGIRFKQERTLAELFANELPYRPDPNLKYYIEMEHEMSFCIKFKRIVILESKREGDEDRAVKWKIKKSTKRRWINDSQFSIEISLTIDQHPNCVCIRGQRTTENSCARCDICIKHYSCNCGLSPLIICRHVHAVHRKVINSTETPEQADQYIQTLVPAFQAHRLNSEDIVDRELTVPVVPAQRLLNTAITGHQLSKSPHQVLPSLD